MGDASMAGITLEVAQAQLDLWLAASSAVASGQEYEIDTGNGRRRLKRADAAEIQKNLLFWDRQVKRLSGTRGRTSYLVPE